MVVAWRSPNAAPVACLRHTHTRALDSRYGTVGSSSPCQQACVALTLQALLHGGNGRLRLAQVHLQTRGRPRTAQQVSCASHCCTKASSPSATEGKCTRHSYKKNGGKAPTLHPSPAHLQPHNPALLLRHSRVRILQTGLPLRQRLPREGGGQAGSMNGWVLVICTMYNNKAAALPNPLQSNRQRPPMPAYTTLVCGPLPTWRTVSSSAAEDEASTPARFSACSPSATCR